MSDDRGVFIPRDGISRRRGIELATKMMKRAAAEWHSGRGDRGCRDNAALVAAYERGLAEGRRQAGVLESIVREAACVTGETITDWQRGYGACSARVLAAIDSTLDDYALSGDAMRWAPDAQENTMTDETRFVLIKPGDVLLLGGVHPNSGEDAVETLRRIKDLTDVRAVVAFADEIEIGRLSAEDLARLIEETSRDQS